jgi:hypothetical protein
VGDTGLFEATLKHLETNRLLTLSGEDEPDSFRKVDMAHEVLITHWPTLRDWIIHRRKAEKERRWLADRAQEWKQLGAHVKRGSGLLDEDEMLRANQWLMNADTAEVGRDEDIQALVQVSTNYHRRQRRQKTALRIVIAVCAMLSLAAWPRASYPSCCRVHGNCRARQTSS